MKSHAVTSIIENRNDGTVNFFGLLFIISPAGKFCYDICFRIGRQTVVVQAFDLLLIKDVLGSRLKNVTNEEKMSPIFLFIKWKMCDIP